MFLLNSWKGRVSGLIGVVLLAVVGFGVYYFWFRDEPADLELVQPADVATSTATTAASTTAASTGTAAATASAAGTTSAAATTAAPAAPAGATRFTILAAQSEAAYFAGEKLAQLPTNSVAKGTTREISGVFYLRDNGLEPSVPSTFTVALGKLTSDNGMRDRRVQQTLESTRFPNATFVVKSLEGFPATLPASGAGAAFKMTGTLEVHGVKKDVTWDVTALRSGNTFSGLAKVRVKYSDFGMNPPNISGFVSVEEDLELQVQVVATAG
jgi:polyisoprenoid-binding protein YceI